MTNAAPEVPNRTRAPIPDSTLDHVLTAQFAVAWAGEGGESPRLGWWPSDLISTYGGIDLFERLTPSTWQWVVYQAAREAARRRDAERKTHVNDPDRLRTLYNLGFELDERVEERLLDLKRTTPSPCKALPGLARVARDPWNASDFGDWVRGHGKVDFEVDPAGRRLKGVPPDSLELLVDRLVAALDPLGDAYPRPHYRRAQ
jgi:hypothetical protein